MFPCLAVAFHGSVALCAEASYSLGAGVVVDSELHQAFLMDVEGGIAAIDLTNGHSVWRSTAATKPLALAGNLLFCQIDTTRGSNDLTIAALDTKSSGSVVGIKHAQLRDDIRVSLAESQYDAFTIVATIVDNDLLVDWQFTQRKSNGVYRRTSDLRLGSTASVTPVAPAAASISRGAVLMNFWAPDKAPEALSPDADDRHSKLLAVPSPSSPLPQVHEPQFLSADGAYIMHSEQIGDDKVWDQYRWEFYQLSTGRRIGSITSHVRVADYAVVGQRQVLLRVAAYTRRIGGRIERTPLQLSAVDLLTHEHRWFRPIRDLRPTGPLPP